MGGRVINVSSCRKSYPPVERLILSVCSKFERAFFVFGARPPIDK